MIDVSKDQFFLLLLSYYSQENPSSIVQNRGLLYLPEFVATLLRKYESHRDLWFFSKAEVCRVYSIDSECYLRSAYIQAKINFI